MLCENALRTILDCLRPDDSAVFAARRMRRTNADFLPVCDREAQVLGTLSSQDLTFRLLADELPPDTAVRLLMTPHVLACGPSDDVSHAQRLMALHRRNWILCLDSHGRLLGALHQSDLVRLDEGMELSGRSKTTLGATALGAQGEKLGTVTRRGDGHFFIQTNGFCSTGQWVTEDEVAWSSRGRLQLKKTG